MRNLKAIRELIIAPKNSVIITHAKPDADALGSALGLAGVLKKLNHSVDVISPTDYPEFLTWMAGNDEVINYDQGNQERCAQIIRNAELIFCLDFSDLKRIGVIGQIVAATAAKKILIDHHLSPEKFVDYYYWDDTAASTAELVYELLCDADLMHLLDKQICEALYAGIMTDTGNFRHPATSKKVHMITSELMELGADVNYVSRMVYDNNSLNKLRFLGYALLRRLRVIPESHTAFFAISKEDLKQHNSKTGDTEGLVNFALSIKEVVFAAVIIEREDEIKLSFRSVGEFSVNDFARKHFEGGGHKNAAGGTSKLTLDETVNKFELLVKKYQVQLQNKKIESNA